MKNINHKDPISSRIEFIGSNKLDGFLDINPINECQVKVDVSKEFKDLLIKKSKELKEHVEEYKKRVNSSSVVRGTNRH